MNSIILWIFIFDVLTYTVVAPQKSTNKTKKIQVRKNKVQVKIKMDQF